jgi:excalibur calcium-binding domain-containing protein
MRMGFKKPFRAIPVRPGPRYQARRRRLSAARLLGGAVVAGLVAGMLAASIGDGGLAGAGLARRYQPPPGAYYSGCNEARAAGVAPLYAGEPGYRAEMDGDGDGIACEPYRSR